MGETPDWVSLSHLWQSRGFMNMPPDLALSLLSGLNVQPSGALSDPTAAQETFYQRYRTYLEAIQREDDPTPVVGLIRTSLMAVPVYRNLTISDVEIDLDPANHIHNVRLSEKERDVVPRWEWWSFTFGIVWALIFHVENEYLRRPHLLWDEIHKLGRMWQGLRLSVVFQSPTYTNTSFYLALYERLLGVRRDIAVREKHYISNIEERSGLKPHELAERSTLFTNAVDLLISWTQQHLQLS